MDTELFRDAISLLRQHIDSESAIVLSADDKRLRDIIDLLGEYDFARSRKITILACCMLIRLAIDRHHHLQLHNCDALTKDILDGDYLMGLYYRFAAGRREWKLLKHLTSFNKKVQLKLLKGAAAHVLFSELKAEIRTYLDRQSA